MTLRKLALVSYASGGGQRPPRDDILLKIARGGESCRPSPARDGIDENLVGSQKEKKKQKEKGKTLDARTSILPLVEYCFSPMTDMNIRCRVFETRCWGRMRSKRWEEGSRWGGVANVNFFGLRLKFVAEPRWAFFCMGRGQAPGSAESGTEAPSFTFNSDIIRRGDVLLRRS